MSAWIVSGDHLDLVVTAAISWSLVGPDGADASGRMLWRENLASVKHRYPRDRDGGRPGPDDFRDRHVDTYRFRTYPGPVDPQVVEPAAMSLAYQSCDHPGWQASSARVLVSGIRGQAAVRTGPYIAEHGPVDVRLQPAGDLGWYSSIDTHGVRTLHCGDGWCVPDRNVFTRAAALRRAAQETG